MKFQQKKWLIRIVVILVIGVVAALAWQRYGIRQDEGLASGNGRIEATEIDVSAKNAGRIKDIRVREGDFVKAGQVVALMDTDVLEAQLREAEAKLQQAQSDTATARSQLLQRESEKAAAMAVVRQREAEFGVAKKRLARSSTLAAEGATSQQEEDDDQARVQSGSAAVSAARAQVAAAEAAITTTREMVAGKESAIKAAQATVERIQADIKDSALKSPRDGRIQYRVAQPGEVPTAAVGKVALGTEVRLVLDAAPQYAIPAKVSFVADVAQFTPKTVETASEREKLMFRVRAQLPVELLQKYISQVKTGLPGVAYVRLDPRADWPPRLKEKLVQ
ncbi:MAG: putative efflux pump membrane fusion protein [Syntrophus sp. PtaU1.Bin208]|nr:MAG: putative efflux pump membrane fusion protein [Syntrophus sp. PtaU1.Bin208]